MRVRINSGENHFTDNRRLYAMEKAVVLRLTVLQAMVMALMLRPGASQCKMYQC